MVFILALGLSLGAAAGLVGSPPQDVGQTSTAQTRSDLAAKLARESLKYRTAQLSPLFRAIANPGPRVNPALSTQQSELAQKLKERGIATIDDWLCRGIKEEPQSPDTELASRLSPKGEKTRAEIIMHFEAILIEGILKPEQARQLSKALRYKAPPVLLGRDVELEAGWTFTAPVTPELVRHAAASFGRQGSFWETILGVPGPGRPIQTG